MARIFITILFFISYLVFIGCNANNNPNNSQFDDKIKYLESKIKHLEDNDKYYFIFDNYRIGVIGIIFAVGGLIISGFVGISSFKALKASDNVEKIKNEMDKIFREVNNKKIHMENTTNELKDQIISSLDRIVLSLSQFSEERYRLLESIERDNSLENIEDIKTFLKNMLIGDKILYEKISYKVNLLHPNEERVEQAIMFFKNRGVLEDIILLEKLDERNISNILKNKASTAIRMIKSRCQATP